MVAYAVSNVAFGSGQAVVNESGVATGGVTGAAGWPIKTEQAWLEERLPESVTVSVKLNVLDTDGVPERTPAEVSVKPAGRVPPRLKVNGAVPPDANSVCE